MTIQVRAANAATDPQDWLVRIAARLGTRDLDLVSQALQIGLAIYQDRVTDLGEPLEMHWRETAGIVCDLGMDAETVAASLVAGVAIAVPSMMDDIRSQLGDGVAVLAEGVARMQQIQALRGRIGGAQRSAEQAAQLEALRKLVLAMVQDVRVVLIKLADQTQSLRFLAGRGHAGARETAARDTFDLFAPLANRLGVWQLKWELEDLAFRCQSPDLYKAIAKELDEKRADREAFIVGVIDSLRGALRQASIEGEVSGRPKHIYSIYRKVSRKTLTPNELFDIRGVRVLVDDVKDCYAALGLVHNLWSPLPREFDDYIAKPKTNNYRSLHTAVVGPDSKVLEVQIRTFEMHQECEFGVAAHWRYKEDERSARPRRGTASTDERIAWLRQILEWRNGLADVTEVAEYFRTGLVEDTVYVLTPQGRVVDLPAGSTPVDFAYHVHTELGHRCRGAKVDGTIVPLDYKLSNGQTVEIIAARSGGPSRDWLNPELHFVVSHRARQKVRQWFNTQNFEASVAQGRQLVEKVMQRAGMTSLALEKLATQLHFARTEEFLAAVGRNEVTSHHLLSVVQSLAHGTSTEKLEPQGDAVELPRTKPASTGSGDVLIVGVDRLLTVLARCCKPVPPDPIIGFVTRGRGVTVHRAVCENVERLHRERLIAAQWGNLTVASVFPVDVEVEGTSDPVLMRELLDVFAKERAGVTAARTQVRDPSVRMSFTVQVSGIEQLRRILLQVKSVPGVAIARRA